MHFSQTLSVAALAAGAAAETYVISVSNSNNGLIYNPNAISAAVGDQVDFVFLGGNHSVTEAAFSTPCMPLDNGFNSGFYPTAAGASQQSVFSYKVADTNPHWFYCAQARHCENGMVGVINPPANSPNTIDAFNTAAKAVSGTVVAPAVRGGDNSTVPAGSLSSNGTLSANSTVSVSSSAPAVVSTSFSQQVLTTSTVVTGANGQTSAVPVTVTTSVAIPVTSQGAMKGQVVGFGAAVAGVAAMFL